MSEWKECKLGELVADKSADLQTGPFGTMLNASEYVIEGTPVIAVQDIGENKLVYHKFVFVNAETAQRLSRYRVIENDIIFGRKGAVERRALIKKKEEGWLQGSDCIRLRFFDKVEPKFASYQFGTKYYQEWMFQNAGGATMPSLNQNVLKELPIRFPDITEQGSIASILSSLDDKIDLLHRQNTTLEAMAETLFRQWFVEEAKEDWAEGKLPYEFDCIMGASPPGESYNEEGIGISMFQGNADFEFRFPKKRVYTSDTKRFAEKYDTLISVRAPVGEQNMASERCCIGRGVAAFRYKANNDFYTYTYFKMESIMEEIKQFNETGTVFGSISKSDFENLNIVIPDKATVIKFQNEVKPIDDKIISNCTQIRTLTALRNTLLPKLMSGEVRVEM